MSDNKQEKEREFHNQAFSSNIRQSTAGFYAVLNASRKFFERQLFDTPPDAAVLEFGCGMGTYSFALAAQGRQVSGIDISDVAIAEAEARAKRERLSIKYIRMDAEALEFPDNSFDLVCGVAILHHLELAKAYACLARVLKPGGKAVFMEPLGHNPAINLYRRMTPKLRTEDEHPLLMNDLRTSERYFASVEHRFFTMNTLLGVPFRRLPGFRTLLNVLDESDRLVFAICPPLRRFAWQTIIVLRDPRKERSD